MTKQKKAEECEQLIGELTQDLQRTRADFENYRKRMESEKQAARQAGETKATAGGARCEKNCRCTGYDV